MTSLSAINTKPSKLPGPSLLHELVARSHVADGPAIDAQLKDGSRVKLSYSELHATSDVLASTIRRHVNSSTDGVTKPVVPVLLRQSPQLYVSQLAILKAGAAFCPLNLDAPAERVRFILGDVQAKLLITSRELAAKLPPDLTGVEVLVLDDEYTPLEAASLTNAPDAPQTVTNGANANHATEDGLAYVMYTSGSTGTPKGVGVSHAAATQSLLAHDRHIPQFRRFLQFAAPTFDVSVFEIFFPLFRGATLVSCAREHMLDDLPGVLRGLEVDACELTPTVAGSLLRTRESAPGLEVLLTIGEMLSEPVVREFGGGEGRESMLWAMYGPTEAAIHCTLVPAMSADASTNLIGIPLDTVSCFVISTDYDPANPASFKVLPAGETGELVVGGHQNAVGYLNRPEQTLSVFIDSPHGPVYRTGDLARLREDGSLECMGRMSEGQVKLRGQRMELGEVEHAALRTQGCHGAVAAVVNNILVLFCAVDLVEPGADGSVEEAMREAVVGKCAEWLPAFMVPGDVVLMRQFPRLASGKVDRKLLRAEHEARIHVDGDLGEPAEQAEGLFGSVLGVVSEILSFKVREDTVLAAAGLDSLAAIRLASRLRAEGMEISAMEVLKARTAGDLCSQVQEGQSAAQKLDANADGLPNGGPLDTDLVVAARPDLLQFHDGIVKILPCTPLQSAMLFETSQDPRAYCNTIELAFPAGTSEEQISEAFVKLAGNTDILRTGFIHYDGGFWQVVFKSLRPSQVAAVTEFKREFELPDDTSILLPLTLQVLEGHAKGPRALFHIHHSLYDGWSMDIILSDLMSILQGREIPPRPQFSDVVVFYQHIPEQTYENCRQFWTEYFLGWERTPFPKLIGRVEQVPRRTYTRTRDLSITGDSVDRLAKQLGCSLQVPFQAALLWLWSAVLGSDDTVIGSVTSGRVIPVDGIERIVGPCIASLPLRANMAGVASIGDLINLVQAGNRGVLQHAVLPLAEIRKLTSVTGGQSLYDVLFVYQESLESRGRGADGVREASHVDVLETPIVLEVEPRGSGYRCQVTYHSGAMQEALVDSFLHQFDCIVQAITQNVSSSLESIREHLPLELSSIHNLDFRHYEGQQDLAAVVEATARSTPDAPAVHFALSLASPGDADCADVLTYGELNVLGNQIARWILESNSGGESGIVAIVMEKSALFYASVMGVLKAGFAYLPLLPSTPAARIQAILEQSRAQLCVADTASALTLSSLGPKTVLNVHEADLTGFSSNDPQRQEDGDRPAYVMYTSGTTGTPKGVVITHANITSHLDTLTRLYPVSNGARLLQSCSQAFDVSVFEIFFAWKTGMTLCSASNDLLLGDLAGAIRSLRITHLSMTPTVASLVRWGEVPGVEFLVTAGEAMTGDVFERWKGALYQGYGPSETTNICTVKKMRDGDNIEHLGFAFENTSTMVFYPGTLTPVPVGCVGELCFGGDQVAKGYLNEPALTAAKFIYHPNFGRVYRSGDLGRMLPDGSLMIMGRLDDQVKLRGQRIDVGEIASIMSRTGYAGSAAIFTAERAGGTPKQLVAFYTGRTASSEFTITEVDEDVLEGNSALFAALEARVPGYMVPSYLIPVSCIPMTPSGKIDRKRLVSAFQAIQQELLERLSRTVTAPEDVEARLSAEEKRVARVTSKALKVGEGMVGRWTPLASLGLDSITAIPVANALSEEFAVKVAISAVIQNPFVAQLASLLSGMSDPVASTERQDPSEMIRGDIRDSVLARFKERELGVERILPCTPLQEAMLAATEGTYYNSMGLRLRADPDAMRSYWEAMCERHGILRTCFMATDDPEQPFVQVILAKPQLRWNSSEGKATSAALEGLKGIVGEVVDSLTPPFAMEVVKQKGEVFLCFVCHHAMYDGVAMDTLLGEVEMLAKGVVLPPSVGYEEFLAHALALPSSTDEFWRTQFRNFQPVRFARREVGSQALHSFQLDASLDVLETSRQALGCSLLSLFQSVWANLLSIITGRRDVCFGNVTNGRSVPVPEIHRLVAPCFNTVPLRVDLSGHTQVAGLMRDMQRLNPRVLAYQFTPLRRVQKVLGESQGLFDTLVVLQTPKRKLSGVWDMVRDEGGMDVPLVVEILPGGQEGEKGEGMGKGQEKGVQVTLYYDGSYFNAQFIEAVGSTLNHLVSFFTKFPSSALRTLEDLPEDARSSLQLVQFTTTTAPARPVPAEEVSDWSGTELKIRTVLSQLSSVPERSIAKNTTIFQLGLDSINAVQVASMLKREGLGITATNILANPTCEKLAKLLEEPAETTISEVFDVSGFQESIGPMASASLVENGVDMEGVEGVLPCTPLQVAMLSEFVQSAGHNYLNYLCLKMDEGVSTSDVLAAWEKVVEQHTMLRAGFIALDEPGLPDHPYVTVKYSSQAACIPVPVVPHAERFTVSKWRLDVAQEVLRALHEPPWRVAVVEVEGRVVLHVAIHHALYDAHSLRLILDDVARGIRGGELLTPPPVEDAVRTILGRVSAGSVGEAEKFWTSFADTAVVHDFPVMTPFRVEKKEMLTRSYTSSLTFEDLLSGTRSANTSIQAALQAAWARLLASYLGEESVVFGTVMSGRVTDGIQRVVFPCIATVPVVARNAQSNRALLQSMMEFSRDVHGHQFSRLTDVQRWLGHAGRRLFDTLLVYQRPYSGDIDPWEVVEDEGVVEYPVSLEVEPRGGEVVFRMTFQGSMLPGEQAEIMMWQFDAVLRHLVDKPDGNEGQLWSSLSDLASKIPAPMPELPSEVRLLHQFVEVQASRNPMKTALEFAEKFDGDTPVSRTWTYAQLNEMGDRVASMLSSKVTPASIVAVHFDKCPEAYFSILGVLKAGCAFLALDPAAPRARKEFILEDSGAGALLVRSVNELDFTTSTPVIEINEQSLSQATSPYTATDVSPEATCYCLYTSGTTGTPKGCEITHDNAVQAMAAFQTLFNPNWDASSRWLQFASLHFDVSVLEQYWSWSVGITLVSCPRDVVLDDLEASISNLGITHIDLTPSLASLVRPERVPSLWKRGRNVFITGGEQLKQEILDVWGPKGVIYNAYGPTEATIGVTMRRQVPINGRSANIGSQFPNVGTYVFRQGTEVLVPRGAVGELCVSGRLVGKGYLNREELTTERFPRLDGGDGERVYRTGDLVRLLHDGSFDFLGRADDQVKLRGQRLQLGEVDHAIRKGVGVVRDVSSIVARHARTGRELLVSFVVPSLSHGTSAASSAASSPQVSPVDSPRSPRKEEVGLRILDGPDDLAVCREARAACAERVPGYMVPTYVVAVPRIPLSRNNKAEVKELRAFFEGLSAEELAGLSAPRGKSQRSLSGVGVLVVEVLGTFTGLGGEGGVDLESSIFELGLDSISVPRLARALKGRGVLGASTEILLRNPVVGDLIQALKDAPGRELKSHVAEAKQLMRACGHRYTGLVCRELGVKSEEVEYVVPCTPIQQGTISRALAGKGGARATYFNAFRFVLEEGTSLERLRGAWVGVVGGHGILRTAFVATPEGFIQAALKDMDLKWRRFNLPAAEFEVEERRLRGEWVASNALNVVRPLEFVANEYGEKATLVVHIFHGLYDGNSFDLILRYVSELYHGERPTAGPAFVEMLPLGPLWKHDFCRGFWERHLKGWQPTQFPSPVDGPVVEDILLKFAVDAAPLEEAGKCLGVTLQSTVLALWTAALARTLSGGITTGVIVSGRAIEADDVERCIGPLFNTVPFFADFSGDKERTWEGLVRRCHAFGAAVSGFQHVALRDVQRWCPQGKQVFENLFTFQVEDEQDIPGQGAGRLWRLKEEGGVVADYPLAFEGTLRGGEIGVVVLGRADVGRDVVEGVMRAFREGLEELLRESGQGVISGLGVPVEGVNGSVDGQTSGLRQKMNGGSAQSQVNGQDGRECLADTPALLPDAATFLEELAGLAGQDVIEILPEHTLANLGLDSIDTVKLVARLRSRGVSLTTREIVRCATIGDMLLLLHNRETTTPPAHSPDTSDRYEELKAKLRASVESQFTEAKVEDVLPPTALQETMMGRMLSSGCELYFNHDLLEVRRDVDLERLEGTWRAVFEASPILRTVFAEVSDPELDFAFCQVVLRDPVLEIPAIALDTMEQVQDIIRQTRIDAAEAGGMAKLFRLHFLRVEERSYVLLSIAHALYDGWSLALLHRDVPAAYYGALPSRPSPELFLRSIHSGSSTEHADFWKQYLLDARPTIIPPLQAPGTTEVHRAESVSNMDIATLTAFGKKHGVSMQVLGQACYAAVLACLNCSLDVTFGVVLSGRDAEGAEDVMFPSMNTVAVRYVLHGSVGGFLEYVEGSLREVRVHGGYPLRKAVGARGLFNTLFLYQKAPFGDEELKEGEGEGEGIMTSVGGESAVEYPLCVELEVVGGALVWRTACDGGYVDKGGADVLLHQLDRVLKHMVRHPEGDLLEFEGSGVSICGLPPMQLAEVSDSPREEPRVNGAIRNEDVWTETQSVIRDVLCQISGAAEKDVTKASTLYGLGLDSITAIKVVANLRQRGVNISVRQLLTAESLSHMATLAETKMEESGPPVPTTNGDGVACRDVDKYYTLANIDKDSNMIEEVLSALPMQIHMLSTWQNSCGEVFYPTFRYKITGVVDRQWIERAWSALVSEMPMLRTCFVAITGDDGPVVQIIFTPESEVVQGRKGVTWGDEVVKGGVQRSEEDIEAHKLVGLTAHPRDDGSWEVDIKIHHALYDATSLPAMLTRFAELCRGVGMNAVEDVDAWRAFVEMHTSTSSVESRKSFWTEYLQGTEPSTGPSAWPSSGKTSLFERGALPDVARLRSVCGRLGVSLQALFFAAYATTLAKKDDSNWAEKSVVFGVYLANRSLSSAPGDTYPTLNLVPLRVLLRRGEGLGDVTLRVQRDIHSITEGVRGCVGLWEVEGWTGVKIDSFVNFIGVEGGNNDADGEGGGEGVIRQEDVALTPLEPEDEEDAGFQVPRWLEGNTAAGCYLAAIDVEAAVRNGVLDIGVFGPSFLLDGEGAEGIVREIVGVLQGVE